MTVPLSLEGRGVAVRLGGTLVLSGVDLSLRRGKITGILGPSGAGKTTLVRALCGLVPLARGRIFLDGREMVRAGRGEWGEIRKRVQPLFQDPGTALNPRKPVAKHLEDSFRIRGSKPSRVDLERAAARAGFPADLLDRFPRSLSGGEKQRAALARILALEPGVLLLDEPFSALDPPLREESGDLVQDLAGKEEKAVLLVTHDMGDVLALADEMGVLGWGRFLEWGAVRDAFSSPLHPWTQALVASFKAPGEPPPPWTLLPPEARGCPFHAGCPRASRACAEKMPPLLEWDPGRKAACHHPLGF